MTKAETYSDEFYADRDADTRYSARTILAMALEILPPVHSAVDFGCGVGTWLATAKSLGVGRVMGFEGDWLDSNHLIIDANEFQRIDFSATRPSGDHYDLALSLEVAEHLPASAADAFVASLCGAADFVVFSAAIPGQGGTGHLNEQWPTYWTERFAGHGFVALDPFRERIWSDDRIRPWYRQNTLLLVKRSRLPELKTAAADSERVAHRVHPDIFTNAIAKREARIARLQTPRRAWRSLRRGLLGKTP